MFEQLQLSDAQQQLMELLLYKEELTRNAMVEKSGFSLLTVSKTVTALIEDGLLISDGLLAGGMGRRQNLIKPNPEYRYVLCVDIGFSSLKLGVIQFNGEVKESHIIPGLNYPVSEGIPYDAMIADLHKYIARYGKERFLGLSVSISGVVDIERDRVLFCPNIYGFNNRKLVSELSEEFDLPVLLDTSARCMAMAEKIFGNGIGIDNQMFISLGYGSIASGIIMGGKSLQGAHGFAGEIGHVSVPGKPSAIERCSCGSTNCLELRAAMAMVISMIDVALEEYKGHSPAKDLMQGEGLTPEILAESYRLGDPIVREEINKVARYIGEVVAAAVNLNDPELITFGGGFVWHLPELVDLVEYVVLNTCIVPLRSRLVIKKSEFDENAPLIGGAMQIIGRHLGLSEL